MAKAAKALGVLALVAVLVIGLTQAVGNKPHVRKGHFNLAAAERGLKGAPAPLASLYAQPSRLIGGHLAAFKKRLASLRGYPVVVNKWGSWCGPCGLEFPIFQRVSAALGKRVAFLGVDGGDNSEDAASFLKQHPVPYPSYPDDKEQIARFLHAPAAFPITIFVNRKGKIVIPKAGQYSKDADLRADIKRYLGV